MKFFSVRAAGRLAEQDHLEVGEALLGGESGFPRTWSFVVLNCGRLEVLMSTVAEVIQQRKKIGFERILVATNFSETSRRALAYAVVLARVYNSELLLVHVLTPKQGRPRPRPPVLRKLDPERIAAGRQLKNLAVDAHLEGHSHRRIVEEGLVWEAIDSVIEREDIDALVLGDHGCGGLKKLIFGSVAEELLRLAGCPTLTVGPQVPMPSADVSGFTTILYVTDFGPASNAALPYALSLAENCRARLILLHTMEPSSILDIGPVSYGAPDHAAKELVDWRTRAQEESLRRLKGLIAPDTKLANPPQFVVDRAFQPDGILRTAAVHSPAVIVMGLRKTRSPRLASHMPGDLVHEVICQAKCPVLTVPN